MLTIVTPPTAPPAPPTAPPPRRAARPAPKRPGPPQGGGRAKGQAVFARTPASYDRLVAAYLANPGNHTAVAAVVGCTRDTARTAFEHGWSKRVSAVGQPVVEEQLEWAPPIKTVLAEHQAMARAKLEARRAEEAESEQARQKTLAAASAQARADLIDSRALQGRSIKQARANAIGLMTVTANLLSGALELGKALRAKLADPNVAAKMSPKEMAELLRAIAAITREGIDAAHIADEMERRALGEPDQIISVEGNMTAGDAAKLMTEAWEALGIAGKLPAGIPRPVLDVAAVEGDKP